MDELDDVGSPQTSGQGDVVHLQQLQGHTGRVLDVVSKTAVEEPTCPRVVVGGQLVVMVVEQHVRDVQQGGQDVAMETVRDHHTTCVKTASAQSVFSQPEQQVELALG